MTFLGHDPDWWLELENTIRKEGLDKLFENMLKWKHRALIAEARLTEIKRMIEE